MIYKLNLEGFAGQNITVKTGGIFSSPTLLVNGRKATIDKKSGNMTLEQNDGNQVQCKFKQKRFGLDVPLLEVGGETVHITEPLKWFVLVWCVLPFGLIFIGGLMGGIIGTIGTFINISIFRSDIGSPVKWVLTAVVTALAVVIFTVGVAVFNLAISV